MNIWTTVQIVPQIDDQGIFVLLMGELKVWTKYKKNKSVAEHITFQTILSLNTVVWIVESFE